MTLSAAITYLNRALLVLLCLIWSFETASLFRRKPGAIMKAVDFGTVYYGARSVARHIDPYDTQSCIHEFESEGGQLPGENPSEREKNSFLLRVVYPPTCLLIVAPFAMLSWPLARMLWVGLIACLMALAGYLAWDLSSDAPVMSGCFTAFILINCPVPLATGNPMGISVPLCIIAVWCFLKDRAVLVGILALAVSLVIKPHDAGFVWLYFLLCVGAYRKQALKTLAVVTALGICSAIWIAPASPHWMTELHGDLAKASMPGGSSDPGPTGMDERSASPVISMQNALSVFKNDPSFYNPVSYTIAGSLILVWIVAILRKRRTREGTLLAMAAISVLTMLPVYHRAEDAKLMLLAIPACAMLWSGKGPMRWPALILTGLAIFITSDRPVAVLSAITRGMPASSSTLAGKLTLLALQPAPLVLLATGCFYLWVYIRYESSPADAGRDHAADEWLDSAFAE